MEHLISREQVRQFRMHLLEEEKSDLTVSKYVRDVEALIRYAGDGQVIDKETVIRYKRMLMERYAPTSVNSMIAAWNSFFKMMEWYDCMVRSLKIQRTAFRAHEKELSRHDYEKLLKEAERKGNKRMNLLIQTLGATGIRVSELPFITVEAAASGRATVSLKGKTRLVLLPSELRKKLMAYADEKGICSGSIFITRTGRTMDRSNILHAMKKLSMCAHVKPSKVYPHNLRHLFACTYYQKEKDLSHLADLLGHSNINTTRIYTCMSGEEQKVKLESLGLVV